MRTDWIMEDFTITRKESAMNREGSRPLALALMGGYNFWGLMTVFLGGGVEIAPEENLGLMRIELEPSWSFGKDKWEVSPYLEYDSKFDAYDSRTVGFSIAGIFGGYHSENSNE